MVCRSLGIVLTLLAATLPTAPAPAQQARELPPASSQPSLTAFEDVNVVPMDRDTMLPRQTVLIWGDRIAALGPVGKVPIPAGAQRVDGRGRYLLPGLGDCHVHPSFSESGLSDGKLTRQVAIPDLMLLYLANGVTTIRLPGSNASLLELRDRIARGEQVGPRIYAGASGDQLMRSTTFDELTRRVAAVKDSGYDFIKMHGWTGSVVTAPQLESLAAAAHQVGIPFAGHTPVPPGLVKMLAGRAASIEHLTGYLFYLLSPTPAADEPPNMERIYDHVADTASYGWKIPLIAALTKQAGVWNCPTMVAASALPKDSLSAEAQGWRRVLGLREKLLRALHQAGAGILLGTDGPGNGVNSLPIRPISEVQVELELLVKAGLTPYEALATGTRNTAEFYGTLDSVGTIAVGKRADVVLLRENPLRDVGATRHPVGTMVGGRWLPAAELKARLLANGLPPQWYPE